MSKIVALDEVTLQLISANSLAVDAKRQQLSQLLRRLARKKIAFAALQRNLNLPGSGSVPLRNSCLTAIDRMEEAVRAALASVGESGRSASTSAVLTIGAGDSSRNAARAISPQRRQVFLRSSPSDSWRDVVNAVEVETQPCVHNATFVLADGEFSFAELCTKSLNANPHDAAMWRRLLDCLQRSPLDAQVTVGGAVYGQREVLEMCKKFSDLEVGA